MHTDTLNNEMEACREYWQLAQNRQERIGKLDRKSTRLNSSHDQISYAVFCLKKKKKHTKIESRSKPETQTTHLQPSSDTVSRVLQHRDSKQLYNRHESRHDRQTHTQHCEAQV